MLKILSIKTVPATDVQRSRKPRLSVSPDTFRLWPAITEITFCGFNSSTFETFLDVYDVSSSPVMLRAVLAQINTRENDRCVYDARTVFDTIYAHCIRTGVHDTALIRCGWLDLLTWFKASLSKKIGAIAACMDQSLEIAATTFGPAYALPSHLATLPECKIQIFSFDGRDIVSRSDLLPSFADFDHLPPEPYDLFLHGLRLSLAAHMIREVRSTVDEPEVDMIDME